MAAPGLGEIAVVVIIAVPVILVVGLGIWLVIRHLDPERQDQP